MFNWKNILKGLIGALIITLLTWLIFAIGLKSVYGEDSSYYAWGNGLVFFSFLPVIIAVILISGVNRRVHKQTKDRYQKVGWDHPEKIKYYDITRVFYWITIFGYIIYFILYTTGVVKLKIDTDALTYIHIFI